MRGATLLLLVLMNCRSFSQHHDALHTARDCTYMTVVEREMIYELNRLRSNPASYLQYIEPLLEQAREKMQSQGKGPANFSLTITTSSNNGSTVQSIDTTWFYAYEEEVKALTLLAQELKTLAPLSILKPDQGIYRAAKKHARDQALHHWELGHTGTDGSEPWNRITHFSPSMETGNENIAGSSVSGSTARDILILLLIDSGIPGYGHRYNMLNPDWTHAACAAMYQKDMWWWIQNFGVKKK